VVLVVALLAAVVSGIALSRPAAARRLLGVVPAARVPDAPRWEDATLHRVAGCLLGLIVFLLLQGTAGAVAGLAVGLGGPAVLGRRGGGQRALTPGDAGLPLALDLLSACLRGGATLPEAVSAVAAASPGSVGLRLGRVAASLAVGAPPEEAFRVLGDEGAAGSVARTLRRAIEGGTPVAAAMGRVAEEARRTATVAAEKRARAVGTKVLAPLGACFLPAFVLVGVVPAMVAIGSGLVGELR